MNYEVIWREENILLPRIEKRIEIAASSETAAAEVITKANKKIKTVILSIQKI